jgi:hypothetical protein
MILINHPLPSDDAGVSRGLPHTTDNSKTGAGERMLIKPHRHLGGVCCELYHGCWYVVQYEILQYWVQ